MDLSVVVPTLNARDDLVGCLNALAADAPDAEVLVVNGPSADGTTGMVQDHAGVDVLVDIADRTINAARNAGLERATGDAVAFVDHAQSVGDGWRAALAAGLEEATVVTGPTHTQLETGVATETVESRTIAGQEVTYFNAGNVAMHREALDRLDGFDEYLDIGGARDFAHRLALDGGTVHWDAEMYVERDVGTDGGVPETDWAWKYRSLAYRLAKNYGLRPTVLRRLGGHAGADGVSNLRAVFRGDEDASAWLGTGRAVFGGASRGLLDGLAARRLDEPPRRNPNGCSSRSDRAVTVYDWR
jgi:glycosyltransferase involved in cell wall biosynthesis